MILVVSGGSDYLNYFQKQAPAVDCSKTTRIRRAWHTLSDVEKQQFVDLVAKMKTHQISVRQGSTTTVYNWFVDVHNTNAGSIHGNSFFLPTHRYLSFLFECALRWMARLYNSQITYPLEDVCTITLPYWDWTLDYENNTKDTYFPQNNSAVFKGGFLGPAPPATAVSTYDVGSSFLSSWVTVAATNNAAGVSFFQNTKFGALTKTLKRLFSPSVVFVFGPNQIALALVAISDFIKFTIWSEGPHNIQHRWLSFQMQTMYSPDDILFWMHHANLDRLWAIQQDCRGWENVSPSSLSESTTYYNNMTTYDTLDGTIPLYWKGGLESFIMRAADFPSPREVWSMGRDYSNYDGMYYRYGPDELVKSDLLSTCPDKTWSWVNAASSKRDVEDLGNLSPASIEAVKRWYKFLETHNATTALYSAAMEECKVNPRVDIDESLYIWMLMQGTTPEWYDRICDPTSTRFYKANGKDWRTRKVIFKYQETAEESTNEIQNHTPFSPVAMIAGVATIAVVVVSLTVFFVVKAKKQQVPKDEEGTIYQLTEEFITNEKL